MLSSRTTGQLGQVFLAQRLVQVGDAGRDRVEPRGELARSGRAAARARSRPARSARRRRRAAGSRPARPASTVAAWPSLRRLVPPTAVSERPRRRQAAAASSIRGPAGATRPGGRAGGDDCALDPCIFSVRLQAATIVAPARSPSYAGRGSLWQNARLRLRRPAATGLRRAERRSIHARNAVLPAAVVPRRARRRAATC